MPWPKRLRQITKERVHGRMLNMGLTWFCPFAQVCDNNGSNFSGVRPRQYLWAVEPSRALIRQRLRDVRRSEICVLLEGQNMRGSGLLARGAADRLLAGSERPQAKVPGERPALLL